MTRMALVLAQYSGQFLTCRAEHKSKEGADVRFRIEGAGPKALAEVSTEQGEGSQGERRTGRSPPGSRTPDTDRNRASDEPRLSGARGPGSSASDVYRPQAGSGGKGRRRGVN